jgi:hypothetical protein
MIAILVVALGFLLRSPKTAQTPKTTTYTDPYSHETITDVQGKTPDTYGSDAASPIYLGFDKLVGQGMTYDQIGNLKIALDNYSKTIQPPIKEVSLDVDHIKAQRDNGTFYLILNLVFDRQKVYMAKVDYTGLNTIHLYLSDAGKQVFDSGLVNSQAAE